MMYQLTIINSGFRASFDHKDKLIAALEQENAKCVSEGLSATCQLQQVGLEGESLEQVELTLPIFEGQTMDELLLKFGNAKVKKAALNTRQKTPLTKPKQDKPNSTMAQQSEKKITSPLKALVLMALVFGLLGLSLGGYTYVKLQEQNQKLITTQKELDKASSLAQVTPKLDVICRYFIPYYYSGNSEGLSQFTAPTTDFKAKTGQLQSVIFESSQVTGKGYQLSYVINVTEDGQLSTKRMTLKLKKDSSRNYGYVITAKPTLSNYPI